MEQTLPPSFNPAPPAPPPPPPPLVVQQAPRRSGGGRGWMIFALILLVLLAFSFLLNVGSFFSSFMDVGGTSGYTAGPKLDEILVEQHKSGNKVAVVEVEGIISSDMFDQSAFSIVEVVKAQLERAADDKSVRAVVLKVNSPGGEVLASDEIYRAIADFQKKHQKPVIAAMGSLAASGGYYVSAPCRWIVANELTLTGSIGVIMSSWNYRGLMDRVGIEPQVYKSGPFKDMMSGSRKPTEISDQERQMMRTLIMEVYDRFKEVVAEGRENARQNNGGGAQVGRALAANWAEYADGRVMSGKEAYRLGFVDELGNFQDAINRAKQIAGITSANIIRYQQRHDLSDLFRMFGKTETRSIKVDVGLDLPRLKAGQPYFLAPSFAQ